MEIIIVLFILVLVASVIIPILWWIFVIWIAVQAFKKVNTRMVDIRALVQQAAATPAANRAPLFNNIQMNWSQAQRDLAHLNDLRRQSTEVQMASIKSEAASMGLFL